MGALAEELVEGALRLEGHMRDVKAVAASLLSGSPVDHSAPWWAGLHQRVRAWRGHTPGQDAAQVQCHYGVSDDFYALRLDPRRVYSCAYDRDDAMTLA